MWARGWRSESGRYFPWKSSSLGSEVFLLFVVLILFPHPLQQSFYGSLDGFERHVVVEALDDPPTLVYEELGEVPFDARRLLTRQLLIHWMSFGAVDIDLSRDEDERSLFCIGLSRQVSLSLRYHRENFSKLDAFEFAPAINLRAFTFRHRFAKLAAREEQDGNVCEGESH